MVGISDLLRRGRERNNGVCGAGVHSFLDLVGNDRRGRVKVMLGGLASAVMGIESANTGGDHLGS